MENEPRRQLLDDEPTTTTFDADEAATGLVPFVRRFALPGILAASVGLGVLGGTLTPARSSETTVATAAAPAATRVLPPETSRGDERPPLEPEVTTSPEPTEAPAAAEGPAPLAAAAVPAPAAAPPSRPASPEATKAVVTGSRYATETLNVRSAPSASADKIATLAQGDKVSITAQKSKGFQQVVVDGRVGWASSEYLSAASPAPEKSASQTPAGKAPTTASKSPSTSRSDAPAPVSGACKPLPGVKPNTERVHQAICARFGSAVSSYIGVRPDWDVEHPSGRALDAMVSSNSTGWAIANYVRANAGSLGVTEVIFDQKIWTTQRASEGWRSMSDRGSATANHRDHVHVSTR